MSKINKDLIERIFDEFFKPYGFIKKKTIWFKENTETIQIIELKKSQWTSVFILNVGIIIKKIPQDKLSIKFSSCCLYRDTLHLTDDIEKRKYLIYLLDIGINDEKLIVENVKKYINYLEEIKIIDLLNELSSNNGILNYLKEGKHYKYLFTKYFRDEEFLKYLQ